MSADDITRESNPECNFVGRWAFVLGPRDSLLVLKALGGRLTTDQDRTDAEALGDRLTLLGESSMGTGWPGLQRAADAVRAKSAKGSA